jgi:hypothetical protein
VGVYGWVASHERCKRPDVEILSLGLVYATFADLGLQRGLQQQPRPDPGHLLDRGREVRAAGEHLVHLGAQRSLGVILFDTGVGSLSLTWRSREEPMSVFVYTGAVTRPSAAPAG